MVNTMQFNAAYVDSISPADRNLFIRYFKEDEEQKRKMEDSGKGPTIGSPIDPFMGAQ